MADIVLKDRNGNSIEYPGVNILKVNTADGAVQSYGAYDPDTLTPENLAEGVTVGDVTGTMTTPESVEKSVELDFSGGDMEVTPEDGTVFNKVNIPIPANLTPENIAEGVDIAGIIGTLAGGGGVVCKYATIKKTAGTDPIVVEHGLGVTPDLIMAIAWSNTPCQSGELQFAIAVNSALKTMLGASYGCQFIKWGSAVANTVGVFDTSVTIPINNVNSETFTLGTSSYPLANSSGGYYYYAIGGLT